MDILQALLSFSHLIKMLHTILPRVPYHYISQCLLRVLLHLYGAVTPRQLKMVLPVKKKKNCIDIISEILNLEGHVNHCNGSKVTMILLKGLK